MENLELSKINPSKVYNHKEITFDSLLEQIMAVKFNGFIKITPKNTEEGHILFKEGKGIAASYSRYLKNFILDEEYFKEDAILKIKKAAKKEYIIEVFQLNPSQIDYAIEFNKEYLLESDYLSPKNSKNHRKSEDKEIKKESSQEIKKYDKSQNIEEPKKQAEFIRESLKETYVSKSSDLNDILEPSEDKNVLDEYLEITDDYKYEAEENNVSVDKNETLRVFNSFKEDIGHLSNNKKGLDTPKTENNSIKMFIEKIKKAQNGRKDNSNNLNGNKEKILETAPIQKQNISLSAPNDSRSINELKLLLKSLNRNEIEMIELNIMNKIKKAIIKMPEVKQRKIDISIDGTNDLTGKVNIVTEYTNKGFLKRITGSTRNEINHMEKLIYNSTQLEIKNAFGGFHEVLDYFDISVKVI